MRLTAAQWTDVLITVVCVLLFIVSTALGWAVNTVEALQVENQRLNRLPECTQWTPN